MKPALGIGVLTLTALLAAGPARAADKDTINAAVDRGVRNLKAHQGDDGTWGDNGGHTPGLTALCGLTLLECGVPVDDGSVQKAAAAVRGSCARLTQTYDLALAILLLDRLGEAGDVPLIESLTVRLLAGQNLNGAWTYTCPNIGDDEQRRLMTLVKKRAEQGPDKAPKPEPGQRTAKDLPREIQKQLEQVTRARGVHGGPFGDNSNTQFAVLGLWVARRHGLPVDTALRETERYFRHTTWIGGGWGYTIPPAVPPPVIPPGVPRPPNMGPSPAMTCAGLLGIGLAYGAWNDAALRTDPKKEPGKPGPAPLKAQDPSKDKTLKDAFGLLGGWVDAMAADQAKGKVPKINKANGKFYYFLWSLERVCVAYGVDTVGKTDWYEWAAEILLANQGLDGGWDNGDFSNGPDTCFALLILKRANLAQDLTRALKSQMKDGMQTALRQGGAGGADLVKGQRPFFEKPPAEDAKHQPADDEEARAARLGKQLTAGEKLDEALKELRENKGAAYTDALARAIPRLEGDALKKARDALAERLSRMTSGTLGVKLDDDDPEVRRAAALAVAMKEDKTHTYKLIELLDDKEATVMHAAHAALKSLSGEDLGPAKGATREEHLKAVIAWKAWWSKRQK